MCISYKTNQKFTGRHSIKLGSKLKRKMSDPDYRFPTWEARTPGRRCRPTQQLGHPPGSGRWWEWGILPAGHRRGSDLLIKSVLCGQDTP